MANGIDLGSDLEKLVSDLVASGRYRSEAEVLRDGVRLIQERESRLSGLDAAVARGIADADAGRMRSAGDVFDRLETRYRSRVDPRP